MKKSELIKIIKEAHQELLKEEIDARYLELKFNGVKNELDYVIKLFKQDDTEKAKEYLQDQINALKGVLTRL